MNSKNTLSSLTLLLIGGNALDTVPLALRELRSLVELDLGSNEVCAGDEQAHT